MGMLETLLDMSPLETVDGGEDIHEFCSCDWDALSLIFCAARCRSCPRAATRVQRSASPNSLESRA